MWDEGYVKIPLARYEELREIEDDANKEREERVKKIKLDDFTRITDRTVSIDEQRSGFFPIKKDIVCIEIDLKKIEQLVIEQYQDITINETRMKVSELTIKDGEVYMTREIKK